MRPIILAALLLGASASAQDDYSGEPGLVPPTPYEAPADGLLPPYQDDAYGPGIGSDATGRPYRWTTDDGQQDPLLRVKPDVYGPGIGQDQYGRPVRREQ